MLWRNIIPALLGSANATAGSAQFYLATFFTAAIWLLWGSRLSFSNHAPHELARVAAIATALIVLFILGRLIVRPTPLLAKPASDLLDNMRHGSIPITLTTLFINGVGEELFFRDVAHRQLADALSPTPAILAQLALYIAVTAAMGIPLLLVASILIGGTAALEAPCRRLHLHHHTASSVEHRNGVLVASGYRVNPNVYPTSPRT